MTDDNNKKQGDSINAAIASSMRNYPIGWGLTTLFLGLAAFDALDTDVMPESMTCEASSATQSRNNAFTIKIGKVPEKTEINIPANSDVPLYFTCEAD